MFGDRRGSMAVIGKLTLPLPAICPADEETEPAIDQICTLCTEQACELGGAKVKKASA